MTMQPPISRISLVALAAASITLTAQNASAQTDVTLQLPNAILLVDSSASMEFKATEPGDKNEPELPKCDPKKSGKESNEASRWIDLIEVLTGTIDDRRCESIPRSGKDAEGFRSEYAIGSVNPPDYGFDTPFHRVMSGTCAPGPHPEAYVALDTAPYSFPSGLGASKESWLRFHPYDDVGSTCSTFTQAPDGLLDTFSDTVRFALMTFDGKKGAQIGALSGGQKADFQGGVDGLWSYFVGASPAAGRPAGCTVDQVQEVGARNIFAPPWEGRMVILPAVDGGDAEVRTTNQQVQDVLIASRPFGATPIAALLADARAYIYEEDGTWPDPAESGRDLGPKDDPYVNGGCRPQIAILLTDGEPNMEMRPFCEGIDGVCPYDEAWETARIMAEDLPVKTKTFVIGFALADLPEGEVPNATSCADLPVGYAETEICVETDAKPLSDALRTCCVLDRIAFNGGTDQAFFAESTTDLRQALSGALSTVVDKTTRTTPVVSSAGSAVGSRVFTEFVPQRFNLWDGVLQRERWECVSMSAEPQAVDIAAGDDFVHNVNQDGGDSRNLFTVIGDPSGDNSIYSDRSIRPFATNVVDGVDAYSGASHWFKSDDVSAIPPKAMAVSNCDDADSPIGCRDLFMKWTLGTSDPIAGEPHRCPNGKCSLIADIFHSTPTVVESVPADGIADETFERFIGEMLAAKRKSALYTSSNDGFFHAFDMDVTGPTNNELFAFVPPAVLPRLQSQYGGNHMLLLDGVPVIRDVPARVTTANSAPIFERGIGDADAGSWRTIAIQGFGSSQGGYFALDVTDPERSNNDANSGPRFLWQLTTSKGSTPLFGGMGATPLITTLFVKDNGKTREVPVAVLPGGNASPVPGACTRSVDGHLSTVIPGTQIQCYGRTPSDYGAQSLTIVRLDTGKILRTFRHAEDPNIGIFGGVAESSAIRSPMTGTPVAYPGRTGAVADRIFVGDRDGTLWRLNTAEPDPKDWKLQIFFDAYTTHNDPSERQPIVTAPVLSVTPTGDVTVAFATGDQEVISATTGMKNYIYSLTEERVGRVVKSIVNWSESFDDGERVTGPLALFNKAVFFSTFAPQPADGPNPCKPGDSRIWGMHYLTPNAGTGGLPMLPENPQNPTEGQVVSSLPSSAIVGAANADRAVIFGVTVAQQPTCESAPEEQQLEGYFGFTSGTFTSSTAAVKGAFELVVDAGAAGRGRMSLLPPRTPVVIDSWVGITE